MENVTIAKYDIDIENIQKKIQQVQNVLSGSGMKSFIPKTLLKDMGDLQERLEKFRKTSPVSTSTHKDIEKFLKEWERVSVELDDLDSKMSKISFSDTEIKENIKEVSELVKKYKEAVKARKDYAEKITSESGVKNVSGGIYRAKLETKRNKMAEAATKGGAGVEEIKSIAQEGRSELKERLTWINQNRTNPEIIKKETKEVDEQLKLWNAIEQSALRYAENQQRNIDKENELNIKLEKQVQFYKGDLITGLERQKNEVLSVKEEVENTTVALKQMSAETLKQEERQSNIDTITSRLKEMFSVATAISTIRHIVRGAIQDFQELDKQFNEIAIVSDYTTQEMWESFSDVNKVAQDFGVETKNVLEVQNLYYHQGKDMAEVNKLTAQTLTLAKITGMDYERATSDLTAALNAYNIAAEDAVRVTDTIAAMDTNAAISSEELMTALTKTASIAANAGMSLESTEVFLTKMIETTREAPENLGTALKTIIARFGEVKQEIDGEVIELADINRVDTALKSIGISLLDTAGQIRDLDEVFMELSSKWDDLDRNTQRYIATIAAGSRQQSRFIAMMEDYDRTLELTEIAQNSAGLGARQLAKSQESIETSVNRLKSTWQEFYSSLITSGMIKGMLELANGVLSLVNKLNDVSPLLGTIVAALAIWAVKTQIADKLVLKLGQSIGEGIAAASGTTASIELMIASMSDAEIALKLESKALSENTKQLLLNEQAARQNALTKRENSKKDMLNKFEKEGWTKDGRLTERGRDILNRKKEAQRRRNDPDYKKENRRYNFDFGVKKPAVDAKKTLKQVFDQTKKKQSGYNGTWKNLLKKQWGKDGFKNSLTSMKDAFSTKGGIGELAKGKVMGAITKAMPILTKIATTLPKIITFITQLINPITLLITVTTGALVAYRKLMGQTLDDTKNIEKLEKAQEKYNNSLKEYNELQENAKIYEKYRNRKNLSEEDLQEQQEAAKALVEEYPSLLDRIDEEGKYHLKNAEEIQKEISAKEELLDINAKQYAQLRLKYAEEGLYTDETTKAGQSMKNLQDYASTLEKDALKNLARGVDETLNLDKSRFYDAMEAYASGEKSSFGYKEFSDWFAGDIGKNSWGKLLTYIEEGVTIQGKLTKVIDDNGDINEEALKLALGQTGAYGENNIDKVAETFIELNEQMGGVLGTLLEGAAEEYSQIEIQQAKITIAKGDFEEDLSSELTDALSQAAVDKAKEKHANWDNLDEKKRTEYIKEETQTIVDEFEKLTKTQIQGLNAVFTTANVGALKVSELGTFDVEADTEYEQEKALQAFWDVLPEEIQRQFPREQIPNLTAGVVETLFELIKNTIGDTNVDEIVKGLISDFNASNTMYKGTPYKINKDLFEGLTLDQIQALTNRTGAMSTEQIAPYLSTVMSEYQKALGSLNAKSAAEVFNILSKADLSTQDGIEGAIKDLSQFGYTAEQVWNIAMKASNGIENISLDNFSATIERAKKELEELSAQLDGSIALMEGKASFEQLSAYMENMLEYWTQTEGITQATELISQLGDSVVATGDGFKIGATAGAEYANSAVEMTKQLIILRIAQQELAMETEMANGTLTDQAKANYEMTIALMKQQYAMIDAKSKQTIQDGVTKDLEKAKEAADKLLESMKNFVNWLREYDRYANLDGVISSLEEEFDHIDFELNFTTNADVVAKDIKDKINNINTRIAANQGGIAAAENEQAMWRDVISKRNSDYVSFDESGNAIVNAEKLQALQEQIANADEHQQAVLQAKYDEIMDNVDAYKESKDKVEDYTKALEDNFSELKKVLSDTYEAVIKTEEKLIQVRQEAEDRELDAVKKKYEAIKDENDKYLDGVRKMVDEERKIRDRADREQDVKDKEKKLAMMKMDTSGIYQRDIQSLEKELEQDYQDLEDSSVDDAIEELEQQFNAEAERLDKETEYLDNYLAYKREKMTEYNEWANQLLMQGSDAVLAYLQANDQEYYTGTAAQKAAWSLEWNNAVNQAVGANQIMGESLFNSVKNNLDACTLAAGGFKQGVEEYSRLAIANNGQIEGTVDRLKGYYKDLAEGVSGVSEALQTLETRYKDAAGAARDLAAAQAAVTGVGPDTKDIQNKVNELSEVAGKNKAKDIRPYTDSDDDIVMAWSPNNYTPTSEIEGDYQKFIYKKGDKKEEKEVWFSKYQITDNKPVTGALWYKQYATGGIADFTGPAWLDGTKSKPEAVLNPLQTQHFIEFVNVLDSIFSKNNLTQTPTRSTQSSDSATYNFTINVDQMANDYDVDKLVSRIEEKMVKASQYRNVNIVKKTK